MNRSALKGDFGVASNPYAPPIAKVEDLHDGQVAPPIWNPNAAANWSLLFSPAFGAFVHMLNWDALKESEKAAAAKAWFVASLLILLVYLGLALWLADARSANSVTRSVGFVYLLVWYFAAGRSQATYVKGSFRQLCGSVVGFLARLVAGASDGKRGAIPTVVGFDGAVDGRAC
jgi:hypothetical protein